MSNASANGDGGRSKPARLYSLPSIVITVAVCLWLSGCGATDAEAGLREAAERGDSDAVSRVLATGVNVNAAGKNGDTALHIAAMWGHADCVESLLAAGAEVDVKNGEGWTPLHRVRVPKVTKQLLAKGADPSVVDNRGATPLHVAMEIPMIANEADGDPQALRQSMMLLIQSGADINARDSRGRTPLHLAAMFGRTEDASFLCVLGADLTIEDSQGETPLDTAVAFGHREVLEVLRSEHD